MIFYACKADGASLGQFEEADLRARILRGDLQSSDYYWCEAMTDWKPISEYRPPGRVTTIIRNLPTRKMTRAAPPPARNTPLKRLKKLLGANRTKR
jgi:GYF domain 2